MAVFRSCNLIAHKCREVISLSTPSEKEQLVRISSLILFNESSYNDYPIEILPDAMKDDYEKIVNKFIRDHPFLLARSEQSQTKIDFTGPAFRDYAPCACSSLP